MREEKLYSTGKTAKMLGIHFVALKRWIYASKVKAIKTPGGAVPHFRKRDTTVTRAACTKKTEL